MMPFVGELAALLTALCWSVGPLAFSTAIRRVGSVQVNVTRLALASVMLGATIVLLRLPMGVTPPQLALLAASGVVGLVLGDSFLFQAFALVGPRLSMLVMSLAPAFAAVLAWVFLDEHLDVTGMAGMAVTLLGVAIVVRERAPAGDASTAHRTLGLTLALLAAAGQAANLILAKQAFNLGPIEGMVAAFVRITTSVLILAPVMIALGYYHNPVRVFGADRRALGLLALGTLTGPYLGITLSLVAIKHAHVGIAATLMATVPVTMLPLVRYVYRERLTTRAKVGALVAVLGVAVLTLL
ncbi:MAG: DMT family transporter [Myxococcota bacterium]